MKQIPFQSDGTADIQRDIKSKLHELAFCLKVKKSPLLGSPTMKGKCMYEHLPIFISHRASISESLSA